MQLNIDYQANPNHEDIQVLGNGIMHYAKLKKNQPPMEFFGFFVRDESNNILGGCSGSIYYGCLYIDLLWLDESIRRKNWGTQLVQAAENLAKEKHALFATVNTMDWEALGFYQKLGYHIEYKREGYLHQSTLYFLRKDFNRET